MCRLYGLRSKAPLPVHRHLVGEDNSLRVQSHEHKDGWGIAHYSKKRVPLIQHGLQPAHLDPAFESASQAVSSRAVVAHLRLASVGSVAPLNAHPFTYGAWTFAHNGTLLDFAKHRSAIEEGISPQFRKLLKGDTDSERCFYFFLSRLSDLDGIHGRPEASKVARALAQTTGALSRLTHVAGAEKPSSMNFLVTNGEVMVASRSRKSLFYSVGGPPPAVGKSVDRLIIASEALSKAEPWHEVPESTAVAVDGDLVFHRWTLAELQQA